MRNSANSNLSVGMGRLRTEQARTLPSTLKVPAHSLASGKMWKLCGRGLALEDVGPVGVFAPFGVHIRAERINLDAFRARVLDQAPQQGQRDASAAQAIVNRGMFGDDQRLAGTAIGELALTLAPRQMRDIAAARCALLAGNIELWRAHGMCCGMCWSRLA